MSRILAVALTCLLLCGAASMMVNAKGSCICGDDGPVTMLQIHINAYSHSYSPTTYPIGYFEFDITVNGCGNLCWGHVISITDDGGTGAYVNDIGNAIIVPIPGTVTLKVTVPEGAAPSQDIERSWSFRFVDTDAPPESETFWLTWPVWARWILKYILFGWLWMSWL